MLMPCRWQKARVTSGPNSGMYEPATSDERRVRKLRVAKLRGYEATRLRGYEVTGVQDYRPELPDARAAAGAVHAAPHRVVRVAGIAPQRVQRDLGLQRRLGGRGGRRAVARLGEVLRLGGELSCHKLHAARYKLHATIQVQVQVQVGLQTQLSTMLN